ncbi:MAG TPA: hypothetical protein V6D10_01620 [Trichocoleus sp.]|jgi:hypothetical protein
MQVCILFRLLSPACVALVSIGLCFDAFRPAYAQTYSPIAPVAPVIPLNGTLVPVDPAIPQAPASTAPAASSAPSTSLQFAFTNTLEYGDCLEVVLQLYEKTRELTPRERQNQCFTSFQEAYPNGSLTQTQALNAIATANFYVTTLLARELYPVRGQRLRVAQQLGFIYKIDETDPLIREMASQSKQ